MYIIETLNNHRNHSAPVETSAYLTSCKLSNFISCDSIFGGDKPVRDDI